MLLAQSTTAGAAGATALAAPPAIEAGTREVDRPDELKARVIAHPKAIPAMADVVHAPRMASVPLSAAAPAENAAVTPAPTISTSDPAPTDTAARIEQTPAASPAITSLPPAPSSSPPLAADPAAAEAVREPLKALAGRTGYAFNQPAILLRQRLFGLAHGVTLLTARCLALPEQSQAAQAAFMAWHDKQANAVVQVMHDLAAYYFGPQASLAMWSDVAAALKLKIVIDQALNELELNAACASLPQAMAGPRYDLTALLGMQPDIAMRVIAGELVQPVGPAPGNPSASPSVKPAGSDFQNPETDKPSENNSDHAPNQSPAP